MRRAFLRGSIFRAIVSISSIVALLACALSTTTDALAARGVKTLGAQLGFAGVSGNEGNFAGYGGGLGGTYGLGDTLALVGNVTFTSNQIASKGGRSLVASQAIGVRYALDVIQIVPYFALLASTYELRGGGLKQPEFKVGAQIAIGVDYLVSRDLLVGLELKTHALPADIFASPSDPTPFYVTSFLKAEYVWGWF